MTWVAWRQFRTQAVTALVLLGAVALTLALTRPGLVSSFQNVLHCKGTNACTAARIEFVAKDSVLRHLMNALALAVPALIGVFWGAPLVAREFETGSFRLAWTQSATRSRWMLVKLGVVGTASMLAAGLFSLAVTWWSSLFDQLQNSPFQQYDSRGIVLIGYAAFAFTLGVAFGLILRRTLPAMAATFFVYFAVHISFSTWIRYHLLSPLSTTSPFQWTVFGYQIGPPSPADWALETEVVTPSGRALGQLGQSGGSFEGFQTHAGTLIFQGVGVCHVKVPAASLRSGNISQAVQQACVSSFHLRQVTTFQPASRYWTFQWMELGLFIGLALLLASASVSWVRRRRS
jgi:ABC-type transport system involved in multi-copper enzyme maturation permease subunit